MSVINPHFIDNSYLLSFNYEVRNKRITLYIYVHNKSKRTQRHHVRNATLKKPLPTEKYEKKQVSLNEQNPWNSYRLLD